MNERIRKLRKEIGLSGEKFGEKIGITKSSLSMLESGKNNPSEQTIKSICREFGVSEEWLRHGSGEMFIEMEDEMLFAEWAGKTLASKDKTFQKRFVKMLMNLSDEEWDILERKANELIGSDE